MVRSLQGGVLEQFKNVLARSVATGMARRDLVSDAQGKVTDVKTAFSSWDNCMKAAFCKYVAPQHCYVGRGRWLTVCRWPVIAVIVIGGLILLGVLWCIIRCCCCGLSCCCSCFQCLKCCGNCCGCCDPPGGRRHKYLDEPYIPPHHGYQQQSPMQTPFAAAAVAPKQPVFEPPQYAEFDMSKKGGEDALPHMPSWEGAGSKKVMLGEEEVEMNNLKKSPTSNPAQPPLATPSAGPVSPMTMEPHSPYGPPRASPNGYMPNQSQQSLVHGQLSRGQSQQSLGHGQLSPGQSQQNLGAYASRDHPGYNNYNANRESNGFGLDQPYDDPAAIMDTHEQHPPTQNYMNNSQNQPYAPPVLAELGPGRQSPGPGRNGYGQNDHMNQVFAEMPAEPVQPLHHGQQSPQEAPNGYGVGRQATGDNMPEGYGMRRRGTGDSGAAVGNRPPYGMDPRMRNSPGPRRTPGPRGDNPYGQSPRASPAPREPGYGQPGYGPPRDQVNRTYSPAPERHFSPAPERQRSPAPGPQWTADHRPPPLTRPPQNSAAFAQSPPQSPITNNSGFDFTSGYARPTNNDRRPSESRQSPTKEAYPGYKPYQPAQEGWSGV